MTFGGNGRTVTAATVTLRTGAFDPQPPLFPPNRIVLDGMAVPAFFGLFPNTSFDDFSVQTVTMSLSPSHLGFLSDGAVSLAETFVTEGEGSGTFMVDFLTPDTVDLRGIWGDNGLHKSRVAARGLDPAQVQLPRKVRDAKPVYPSVALSTNTTGTVTSDCIIATSGEPQDCLVIGGPEMLRTAATDAVVQWRFDALKVAGVQRAAAAHLTVNFNIDR